MSSQTQKVMTDKNSDEILGGIEKIVWEAWKHSDQLLAIWVNTKYPAQTVDEEQLKSYRMMECNMSLKTQFLPSHLIYYQQTLETSVTIIVIVFIRSFLPWRKWNLTMLAGYCWQLKREAKLTWKIF